VQVKEVAGNTEDDTFVLTTDNEIVLLSVYEPGRRVLKSWPEGYLSHLTAGHSTSLLFGVGSGPTLIFGTEHERAIVEFDRDVVNIELNDRFVYVSGRGDVSLIDIEEYRYVGSFIPGSEIKSFDLVEGLCKVLVWGENHIDVVDFRMTGETSCIRTDWRFGIEHCDFTIGPQLIAVSSEKSVGVIDLRWPSVILWEDDCRGKHGIGLQAKWLDDTSFLVVASSAGMIEVYDLGGDGKQRIGEYGCDVGVLIDLQTSDEWAFVEKTGCFTCIRRPAED
jgi:hypothetical protein